MRIPKDIVDQRMARAPANIRNAATSESLVHALSGIAAANELNSEQVAALEEETLYFLLEIENPGSFSGNIHRYLGVPEETANGIAQSVSKVIASITSSSASSALLPFMHSHPDIEVTHKVFKYGPSAYPIHSISEVSLIKMPFEFGTLVINGMVILFLGIPLLLSFSGWSILGILALGICGFNVRDIFKKHYVVTIAFQSTEEITVNTTSSELAIGLRDALQEAMHS